MYQTLLVPLDGSELAEVVFPYAEVLAGRLGMEVILLHISRPVLSNFTAMNKAYIKNAADTVRQGATDMQARAGPTAAGKAVQVRGELVVGDPPDEILRYADEKSIDLILVASHGKSGVKRWAMGSVADKVLRASRIPVWLVHAGIPDQTPYDKWPKRTLIVPLDGSELAESVIPHVEALTKQDSPERLDVVLLRVCEPPAVPTYYSPELSEMPLNWGQYAQQETARCKQVSTEYLAKIEKRFRDNHITARSEVLVGKATDEVINYANKNPFAVIVMATHGRSGFGRLVYGSVAVSVLVGVDNPVVLIKPQTK
jgi:nucleotide-binding universal stress UspA family protein